MPAVRSKATQSRVTASKPSTPSIAAIHDMVRRVPEGKVASYGQICALLGYPRHSRFVGQTLSLLPPSLASPTLPQARPPPPADAAQAGVQGAAAEIPLPEPEPNPDWVPWHRVVSSKGVISLRNSGRASLVRQADWLRAEGVEVIESEGGLQGGGRVRISDFGWDGH